MHDFGVPNYFDDQRFGSHRGGGPFLARPLMLGEFEEAFAWPSRQRIRTTRKAQKQEKQTFRALLWADWPAVARALPRSHARGLVDFLVHHPQDFRGALERCAELRGLYLSARHTRVIFGTALRPGSTASCPRSGGSMSAARCWAPCRCIAGSRRRTGRSGSARHPPALRQDRPGRRRPHAPFFERVLAQEGLTAEHFRLKGFEENVLLPRRTCGAVPAARLTWEHAGATTCTPARQAHAKLRAAGRELRDVDRQASEPRFRPDRSQVAGWTRPARECDLSLGEQWPTGPVLSTRWEP